MPSNLAGFLIVLTALAAHKDPHANFPSDLARWYVTEPPQAGSEQELIANNDSKHEWLVILGKAGPEVKWRGHKPQDDPLPFDPPPIKPGSSKEGLGGRRTSAKVNDGWIVGFDAGEFGGALWWFSPDGTKRTKVMDANVLRLIPTKAGLLAIEGIAHGGTDEGKVIRLVQDRNGRWQGEVFADLGHAPQVVVKDVDGSLVVATTNQLLRIIPSSKKVVVMIDHVFWDLLYPNSMVIAPSGAIFVGMRHGVARLKKQGTSYKVEWLLPSKKFAEQSDVEGFK